MKRKVHYFLFLFFLIFSACVSSYEAKKVNISKHNIVIGWKRSKELGSGYYILIEKIAKGKWVIKKISKKPIIGRENKRQEILFVNKNLNYVQPFFEKAVFYPGLKTFKCVSLHKKSEKELYTPCNSCLTKVDTLTTIFKPGVNRGIDTKKITQIIEQTDLLEKVRLYDSLIERFQLEEKEYYNFVSNISINVKRIEDKTRLFLIKPNDVNLSKKIIRVEIVNLPKDFDENFDKYSQEDIRRLFANKKIELQPYVINPILKDCHYCTLRCFGIVPQNYSKVKILYNNQNYTPFQLNIPVIINSCDLINPYPSNFVVKDKNLSIKVLSLDRTGMKLLIKNMTTSYVKISSVTLYYNNKVLNVDNLNIELPPQSLKENVYIPGIGFYFLPFQVKEFKRISKDNLNFHVFTFGLAVKYNIVVTNIEKTLYKVNTYNLATILF